MSRAPVIPAALTTGPFSLEEARRHGLTKDHLLGASWQRLGGGFYALRAIAHDPDVVLAATSRRLPMPAVFSGRTAGWLHGLDLAPLDPVEVSLPLGSNTSRLTGIAVRRSDFTTRFLGRPDFYYPLARLAVEYDGAHHRENLTGDTGARIDWSMRATACCASQQRMCYPVPIRSWPS